MSTGEKKWTVLIAGLDRAGFTANVGAPPMLTASNTRHLGIMANCELKIKKTWHGSQGSPQRFGQLLCEQAVWQGFRQRQGRPQGSLQTWPQICKIQLDRYIDCFPYQRPGAVLSCASLMETIAIAGVAVAGALVATVQHLVARLFARGH